MPSENVEKSSISRAHERLDKSDTRLSRVESDVHALRKGQEDLALSVGSIARDMNAQHSELTQILQKRTTRTMADLLQVMQGIIYAGVIIASVVTMVVYIAGNANGPEYAVLKYRMDQIFGSTNWRAEWRRSAPEAPPGQ